MSFRMAYSLSYFIFIGIDTCWLIVQPGEAFTGVSREEYIDKVASDILIKLPVEFDLDKIRKKLGMEISPTTVVLLQELERFNILNGRMNRSLSALRKVNYGYRMTAYTSCYVHLLQTHIRTTICHIIRRLRLFVRDFQYLIAFVRRWNFHKTYFTTYDIHPGYM